MQTVNPLLHRPCFRASSAGTSDDCFGVPQRDNRLLPVDDERPHAPLRSTPTTISTGPADSAGNFYLILRSSQSSFQRVFYVYRWLFIV
jgi:hypothetical protein